MSLTETGSWVPLRIQSGFLSLGSGLHCTVSCVCFCLGLAPLILALPENNCRHLLFSCDAYSKTDGSRGEEGV